MQYYFLYKITNLINNKIYIGVHSTNNLDDGYMGSGLHLKHSQNYYGIKNFKKEILYRFENKEAMYFCESIIVDQEFIDRIDTYNHALGGQGGYTNNYLLNSNCYIDKDQNILMVSVDDPRVKSGELIHIAKGKVSVNDPRYLSRELVHALNNTTTIYKNNKTIRINCNDFDPKIHKSIHKNKVVVRDKNNKTFKVDKDDPRIKSGELVYQLKGKHWKNKMKLRKCPHCKKEGKGGRMTVHHFDNCKFKS